MYMQITVNISAKGQFQVQVATVLVLYHRAKHQNSDKSSLAQTSRSGAQYTCTQGVENNFSSDYFFPTVFPITSVSVRKVKMEQGLINIFVLLLQVWFLRFSHSGSKLATGAKDGTVIIWDVSVSYIPVHVLNTYIYTVPCFNLLTAERGQVLHVEERKGKLRFQVMINTCVL